MNHGGVGGVGGQIVAMVACPSEGGVLALFVTLVFVPFLLSAAFLSVWFFFYDFAHGLFMALLGSAEAFVGRNVRQARWLSGRKRPCACRA